MEERKLTEKESLEVITSMIARTKQRYLGGGNILLMWGYLVAIVTLAVWLTLVFTHNEVWNWLWFAIPLIGLPATVVMARSQRRSAVAVTYSDKVTSCLWTITGLSELVLMLFCLAFSVFGGIKLLANWYMPIFIFAWVAMMIVPGHILNRKARQA